MKIAIKFEGEPEFYPFETDKKDWYITRKNMAYVIRGLSYRTYPTYEVQNTVGDFLENPSKYIGAYMIYDLGRGLFGYSPKIVDVKVENEIVQKVSSESKGLSKLTEKILFILDKMPDTRNDDILLTVEVWKEFYGEKLLDFESGKAVMLSEIFQLPREDHIKRIRAKIQNDEKRFLPTSWEVAKKRKINQGVWELAMQEMTKTKVNS